MRAQHEHEEAIVDRDTEGRMSWRSVLVAASAITAVVLIVVMVVQGSFIPPIVALILLMLIGLVLLGVRERAGTIMLAIISVVFLALNLRFIIPALSVPESSIDFLASAFTVLGLIAMVVASIALIRRRSGGALGFTGSISALALVAVAVATVARIAYDAAEAQEGDIRMTLENFEFSPGTIQGGAREVSVFLDNKDAALHTFTIDELDVDVNVPANGSARVTFDAPAGNYDFYCVPHKPDMDGRLDVGG